MDVDAYRALLEDSQLRVTETLTIPGRQPAYGDVPKALAQKAASYLSTRHPAGLFRHQALALEHVAAGRNVTLSTSTASGKSLVFMAGAAHVIAENGRKVAALYPARALIQDQLAKWQEFGRALGLRVGFVDGSVPTTERPAIFRESDVVLLTPDVTHAWVMSHLATPEVRDFVAEIGLLVLDEAHVYDGVFGTNMAYLMRRIEAATREFQLICSTATVSDPQSFVRDLTGRHTELVSESDDGAGSHEKIVLVCRHGDGKVFDHLVEIVKQLQKHHQGVFLAFADSRKMVEQVVAAVRRSGAPPSDDLDDEPTDDNDIDNPDDFPGKVLPYRAGYENVDRLDIEDALRRGTLSGVVSTSALELGLDIGNIDLVVLLSTPPSTKAFRQRIGRAGRQSPAVCIVIDDRELFSPSRRTIAEYLSRPVEPNRLYLDNIFIRYAHVLCAAGEATAATYNLEAFESLPNHEVFTTLLENERNPTESVPPDLYPLKQRAIGGGPHYEFPIRSDMEPEFKVIGPHNRELGTLALSQVMREAYPGAIYYYMAKPYRVCQFKYSLGEIRVRREMYWTTQPITQTKIFPRFDGGVLHLSTGSDGFIAESELQVSEKVDGFTERRGTRSNEHHYGPTYEYYQRPLQRFFTTTGVSWWFPQPAVCTEAVASAILETFCLEFGIHERDLGVGSYFSRMSPVAEHECHGASVYDSVSGSLRLTKLLAENFRAVVERSLEIAQTERRSALINPLSELALLCKNVNAQRVGPDVGLAVSDGDWFQVVAPRERAMLVGANSSREVSVQSVRYTPQGLVYDLVPEQPDIRWTVPYASIQPIFGETRLARFNVVTGELR